MMLFVMVIVDIILVVGDLDGLMFFGGWFFGCLVVVFGLLLCGLVGFFWFEMIGCDEEDGSVELLFGWYFRELKIVDLIR